MDLQVLMNEATNALLASPEAKKAVEDRVKKTFEQILDDQLSRYSAFGKTIEASLKQAFTIDPTAISFPEYQQLLLNYITEAVAVDQQIKLKFGVETILGKFFTPLPESLTITEVVRAFILAAMEGFDRDEIKSEAEFTLIIERSRGFTYIYLDQHGGLDKYKCQFNLGIHDGRVFTANDSGVDFKSLKMRPPHGFASFLFKAFSQKIAIVDDNPDVYELAHFPEITSGEDD